MHHRIAIVDNAPVCQQLLSDLVRCYADDHSEHIELSVHEDSATFLDQV